jgi:hypothetical protein
MEFRTIKKNTLERKMYKLYIPKKEQGELKSIPECWIMQLGKQLPFTFKYIPFSDVYHIYYDADEYHEDNKAEIFPCEVTREQLQQFCTNYKLK